MKLSCTLYRLCIAGDACLNSFTKKEDETGEDGEWYNYDHEHDNDHGEQEEDDQVDDWYLMRELGRKLGNCSFGNCLCLYIHALWTCRLLQYIYILPKYDLLTTAGCSFRDWLLKIIKFCII